MHYVEGSEGAGNGSGPIFVMKHKANSMKVSTSQLNKVWYVYFGASNHMTSHEEWFSYLEKPEQSRVVETGDDTLHTIEHVGEVSLIHVGQKGKLMNVLHIPTITKSLVSFEKIVDQGMHVRFMHLKCFIEEEGRVIVQGRLKGGCSSSTLMKLEPRCLRKGKRSSWISTYGTSGLAMSTSHSFEKCRQKILFSDCQDSVSGTAKSTKPAN